jgi:hypothetical protein
MCHRVTESLQISYIMALHDVWPSAIAFSELYIEWRAANTDVQWFFNHNHQLADRRRIAPFGGHDCG